MNFDFLHFLKHRRSFVFGSVEVVFLCDNRIDVVYSTCFGSIQRIVPGRGKKKPRARQFAVESASNHGLRAKGTSRRSQCGKVSAPLPVPDHIQKPPYVRSIKFPELLNVRQIHGSEGIAGMRAACQLAARVLDHAETLVRPSVSTDDIDVAVHDMIIQAGAYPSSLGYGGFPKSICISVNDCMCHGIPDSRPLEDGDVVTIDVMVYLNGYHGDTARTFVCGNASDSVNHLLRVTKECLERGMSVCRDGAFYRTIGNTISEHARLHGYGVVEDFAGHGIGRVVHALPIIFHFNNNEPCQMVEGETFTIEPVLTLGNTEHVTLNDNWTVISADGCLSAHFEHAILITKYGFEVLTK